MNNNTTTTRNLPGEPSKINIGGSRTASSFAAVADAHATAYHSNTTEMVMGTNINNNAAIGHGSYTSAVASISEAIPDPSPTSIGFKSKINPNQLPNNKRMKTHHTSVHSASAGTATFNGAAALVNYKNAPKSAGLVVTRPDAAPSNNNANHGVRTTPTNSSLTNPVQPTAYSNYTMARSNYSRNMQDLARAISRHVKDKLFPQVKFVNERDMEFNTAPHTVCQNVLLGVNIYSNEEQREVWRAHGKTVENALRKKRNDAMINMKKSFMGKCVSSGCQSILLWLIKALLLTLMYF